MHAKLFGKMSIVFVLLKLTTDKHKASRGLSATARIPAKQLEATGDRISLLATEHRVTLNSPKNDLDLHLLS